MVFKEYNINYPPLRGLYEVDHLIPLEVGGNNDIKNLWPEPTKPFPGSFQKDVVENYLHDMVCIKKLDITDAQNQIIKDWYEIYKKLTPVEVEKYTYKKN